MKKVKLTDTYCEVSEKIEELVMRTDQKLLAIWAADCAERMLPYFEEKYPEDMRPREAIESARTWVRGEITLGGVHSGGARTKALAAHASAREIDDDIAIAVARATGHVAATVHIGRHALGTANYLAKAVIYIGGKEAMLQEREWQYEYLQFLIKQQKDSM